MTEDVAALAANARVWPVPDLRGFLAGDWRIERTIRDRLAGTIGRLDGTARFATVSAALRYAERGVLSFGTHRGPAEQSYLYEFPEAGRAVVRFRDGRLFHELDLTRGQTAVVHFCGADVYRGRFAALDAANWWGVWRVTGPRKDLRILTRYARAA